MHCRHDEQRYSLLLYSSFVLERKDGSHYCLTLLTLATRPFLYHDTPRLGQANALVNACTPVHPDTLFHHGVADYCQ